MSKKDKTLIGFVVLWKGWEMDNHAWVMEKVDGTRYLKMTDHGQAYEAEVSELEERISEYEKILADSKKALGLLLEGYNYRRVDNDV